MPKIDTLLQRINGLLEAAPTVLGMSGEPSLFGNQEGSWSGVDAQSDPRLPYTVTSLGMNPSWDFQGDHSSTDDTDVFTGWNAEAGMEDDDDMMMDDDDEDEDE